MCIIYRVSVKCKYCMYMYIIGLNCLDGRGVSRTQDEHILGYEGIQYTHKHKFRIMK